MDTQSIRTFDLKEAAEFLKMTPEGLRRKAVAGEIPGAKPGKRWCFREDDLAAYLRSLYPTQANASLSVTHRRHLWHSTNQAKRGGFPSTTVENDYKKLLGLPIK